MIATLLLLTFTSILLRLVTLSQIRTQSLIQSVSTIASFVFRISAKELRFLTGLSACQVPPSRLKGHFFGQRADNNGARVIVIIRAGGQRHNPRHSIGRGPGPEQGSWQRIVEVGVELSLRVEHGVALRIGGCDEGSERLDAVGRPLGDVPDDGVLLVKLLIGKLIEHGKHRARAHMVAVNYRVKAAHGGVVGAVHEQRAV